MYPFNKVADCESNELVTTISYVPAGFGGVWHLICVAESTITEVHETFPIFTVAPVINPDPVTTMGVPPSNFPLFGDTLVMVGDGDGIGSGTDCIANMDRLSTTPSPFTNKGETLLLPSPNHRVKKAYEEL